MSERERGVWEREECGRERSVGEIDKENVCVYEREECGGEIEREESERERGLRQGEGSE